MSVLEVSIYIPDTLLCGIARIIKSKIYEEHFAHFIGKFELHRQKLMAIFLAHTAQGVDMINNKVDGLQNNFQDVGEFAREGLALFRRMSAQSTQRETEIMAFIDEHHGIEFCLNDDSLFKDLAFRTGDLAMKSSITSSTSGQLNNNEQAISKKKLLKETLLKEISEDVHYAFKENMVLFERKLELQQETILRTLRSGAHDRITDPVSVLSRENLRDFADFQITRISKPFGEKWCVN